jgi:hypothetical protein
LLVVGDEGLLKELGGKLKPHRKRRTSGSERSSRDRQRVLG